MSEAEQLSRYESQRAELQMLIKGLTARLVRACPLASAVVAVLRCEHRAMNTQDILEQLREAGCALPNRNALSTVYCELRMSPLVRRVGRNTWGLRVWYPSLEAQPQGAAQSVPVENN
jgi:DNA-directed RNA polymerase delta subunit